MSRPTSPSPSRRTLVKGAAWAVPAVAVASAAPAFAMSPGTVEFEQTYACKNPGASCPTNKFGYQFTVTVTNTWPADCTVTVTDFDVQSYTGDLPAGWSFPTPFVVPADGATFVIRTNSTNSANITFDAYVVFTYNVDCPGVENDQSGLTTAPQRFYVAGTPPTCPCEGETISVESDESAVTGPELEATETDAEAPAPDETPAAPEAETPTPDAQVPAPEVKETPDVQAPDTSEQTATPSNS